jgi:hypothetical protein
MREGESLWLEFEDSPLVLSLGGGIEGFSVASASPLAGPIFNSDVAPLPFSCGAGSSPDSVDGFFEERDVSEGEGAVSEGTTKLEDGFVSLASGADSTITFPFMSTGMRRVTILGTSCISVDWTFRAMRCGT